MIDLPALLSAGVCIEPGAQLVTWSIELSGCKQLDQAHVSYLTRLIVTIINRPFLLTR